MKHILKFGLVSVLIMVPKLGFGYLTNAQVVSKVAVQDDGGTAGAKIYVFTSDNNGKWGTSGGCVDPAAVLIPATSYSKKEWLSVLLTAKSSGQKVVIEFDTCADPAVPKAITLQP